jgi:hypothetical protein
MAARHSVMLLEEEVYGTPKLTTGAPTTARYHYERLDSYTSPMMVVSRNKVDIPRGDGLAGRGMVKALPGGTVTGQLRTVVCWSTVERLLGWCGVLINSGKTAPWTVDSGQTVGDLASLSLYEGYERDDGTMKLRAAYGCKVSNWTLSCSRDSPLLMLSADWIGQKPLENDTMGGADTSDPTTTEFPAPSATSYATDPILFDDLDDTGSLTGFFKIASDRTNIMSVSVEVSNALAAYRGQSAWLEKLRHFGARDVSVRSRMLLKASPDDRTSYESQTALDVQIKFVNSAKSLLIDLNAANRISEPPAQTMTPGQWYEQEIVVASYRDTAETTDLVITIDDTE